MVIVQKMHRKKHVKKTKKIRRPLEILQFGEESFSCASRKPINRNTIALLDKLFLSFAELLSTTKQGLNDL